MGCFLRSISSGLFLITVLGPLFADLRGSNSPISLPGSNTLKLQLVKALSTNQSPPRRPPRIRPKRQSPNAPSDESSYGSGDNKKDNRNQEARKKHQNEPLFHSTNEESLRDPSLLSAIRFADRIDLHPCTKEALEKGFGLQIMTHVQAETYEAAREGRSVLARSKTGSGKTLAFLLPTIERLLDPDQSQQLYSLVGRSIGCVVLAPTRELAIQIAEQAEVLVRFHNQHRHGKKQLRVACIYGGVKMQRDVRELMGDYRGGGGLGGLPTILVATPSRLLEHLEGNSPLNKKFRSSNGSDKRVQLGKNKSRFASILGETKIVVLDETDRLLQKSNRHETQKILGFMARAEKRQTLLFSATFPRAVRRLLSNSSILSKIKKQAVGNSYGSNNRNDYLEVDCIRDEETNTEGMGVASSNNVYPVGDSAEKQKERVEELFVVLENMSQFIPSLLTIIRREQQRVDQSYKILVFFPAGRIVRFLFQFFTIGGLEAKENLWEIHSRMSQSSRTRASNSFRKARKGILFSSDVSARGLDYPDVSLVIQMGAPSSYQDYIHRIGRTGRAGKAGKGLMVLLPFERKDRKRKREGSSSNKKAMPGRITYRNDNNIKEDLQLASWLQGLEASESLYQKCKDNLEPTRLKVRSGHVVLTPGAQASYKTFLAHYVDSGRKIGNNKKDLAKSRKEVSASEILSHAKEFAEGTGLPHAPSLDDEFLSKLGLPNHD